MKNIINVVFIAVISFFILGCSGSNKEAALMVDMSEAPMSRSVAKTQETNQTESIDQKISSDDLKMIFASSENHVTDTMLNLIRTADIKFRVSNIIDATISIEDIVNNLGGYIENTQLINNNNRSYSTPISADSVLITRHYTATNTVTIRIPNKEFNTILKNIVPYINHLDYRNINTNDVTINLIKEQLAQNRAAQQSQRLQKTVDTQKNKLNDVINAEDKIAYRQEKEDEAKIAKLIINNKIRLSTIQLVIYQNNIVDKETVAIEYPVKEYQPSFGSKLVDGLKSGWAVLENILLFLISNWSVLLIIALIISTAVYFKRKRKK